MREGFREHYRYEREFRPKMPRWRAFLHAWRMRHGITVEMSDYGDVELTTRKLLGEFRD